MPILESSGLGFRSCLLDLVFIYMLFSRVHDVVVLLAGAL